VRGLATGQPVLAGCLGLGTAALIGLPPFSIFASEVGIARAGFARNIGLGTGWATAVALVLVVVIAAAMVGHTSRMLLGAPRESPGAASITTVALPRSTAVAMITGLLAAGVLGTTTGPLSALLGAAADILGGAP
jgi:hydrogenase-4 component F